MFWFKKHGNTIDDADFKKLLSFRCNQLQAFIHPLYTLESMAGDRKEEFSKLVIEYKNLLKKFTEFSK